MSKKTDFETSFLDFIEAELGLTRDISNFTMSLLEDLKLDSLEILEFYLNIEIWFDIDIPENIQPEFETLNDVYYYLKEVIERKEESNS